MKKGARTFLQSDLSKLFPSFEERPWSYFLLFAAVNAILSYGPLGLSQKVTLGLLGLGLPILVGSSFLRKRKPGLEPLSDGAFLPLGVWPWAAVFALSLFPRLIPFFGGFWPLADDGLNSFFPMELSKEWKWQFSFTPSQQVPPLYYWAAGLYYRALEPSLFSARLFQLLLSVSMVGLSGFLFRRALPPALGFTTWAFFSLGFCTLFCSRYLFSANFILLWEISVLMALFVFLKSVPPGRKLLGGTVLGGLLGLGFWISLLGFLVPGAVLPPFFLELKKENPRQRWVTILAFGLPFLLLAVPYFLLFFWLRGGGDNHIQWLVLRETRMELAQHLDDLFSNLTCLFWVGNRSYSSSWGGMFNPLEGGLFILGLSFLWRLRKEPLVRWGLMAFLIFMLPGLMTSSYEIFHNMLVFPFLYFPCALGIRQLLIPFPRDRRGPFLAGLLLVSGSFSVVQLWKTFSPVPSLESQAYGILKRVQAEKGPGWVLLDLRTDDSDHTLSLAVYPFNAAENPRWRGKEAGWAAVLCNAHYKTFLSRRFPDSTWHWLGPDGFWNQGGLVLAVIPLGPERQKGFQAWLETDRWFHAQSLEIYSRSSPLKAEEAKRKFLVHGEKPLEDPFLESVFCEKAVFYQKERVPAPQLLSWIQRAVTKGYPAPHLLVTEGLLLKSLGRIPEARAAFERAVHSPMDLTTARQNLAALPPRR